MAQPFLHELVTCVRAPTAVLSGADGQIRAGGVQGVLHADIRFLSELVVTVDDREPLAVGARIVDGSCCRFVGALMGIGDPIPDPTVLVERERTAHASGLRESVIVVNESRHTVRVALAVRAGVDLADVGSIRDGHRHALLPGAVHDAAGVARWRAGAVATELRASGDGDAGSPMMLASGEHVTLTWQLEIPARGRVAVSIDVEALDERAGDRFVAAMPPAWVGTVDVVSAAPHLAPLVHRSLGDLAVLMLGDPEAPDDAFAGAGSPWFLTLFGRDSIWAARFALPIGTDLAAGTLRTLARRQARDRDPTTGAEPGKILHEVRTVPLTIGDRVLPPLYYGTVDATPLWISLLHDAWCWGLAGDVVTQLLDPLEAALGWVLGHGAEHGGFLSYRDATGRGLANQGWKDSGDAIQDAGGEIAVPPITLCEVQGYAHRAALDAARLLDTFERPGADRARAFAHALAERFRASFWVDGPSGRFPAVALDADGKQVDSLTSNIGHLLATGLLDADESAIVADWLAGPRLDSGYGLRTLDAEHPFFNPVGYHSGSVWPHDTAIAIDGLVRTGHAAIGSALVSGLLAASPHFDYRLPELLGGWPATTSPLCYPAACRPQAWAAGAAVVVLRAVLGLEADVPAGTLTVGPHRAFADLYPLEVRGLQVMGHRLDVSIDVDGQPRVVTDAPLTIVTR